MVLLYLKGFLYFLCSLFGEWFGLFLLRFLDILRFILKYIQTLNNFTISSVCEVIGLEP
jgi:hypothetical protein